MTRALMAVVCLAILGSVSGCRVKEPVMVTGNPESAVLKFADTSVRSISNKDHTIALSNGLIVFGDSKLTGAISEGTVAEVVVLERFPPIYVVRFGDGATRRYRSRKSAP